MKLIIQNLYLKKAKNQGAPMVEMKGACMHGGKNKYLERKKGRGHHGACMACMHGNRREYVLLMVLAKYMYTPHVKIRYFVIDTDETFLKTSPQEFLYKYTTLRKKLLKIILLRHFITKSTIGRQ